MIACPKCNTPNREGSKRCASCGEPLPELSQASRETLPAVPVNDATLHGSANAKNNKHQPGDQKTEMVETKGVFLPRPIGAIFGDRFQALSLIYSDEMACRYSVAEFGLPNDQLLRQCPSPECGAIHSSWVDGITEQFCTVCGTPLQVGIVELVLTESARPIFDSAQRIINLGLVHSNVRAPLAYFTETVGGVKRYCLVAPKVDPLPSQIERPQALKWGIGLAKALDYLCANGFTFGGAVDESCFGLAGEQPVWSNLTCGIINPDRLDQARQADIRSLALLIFKWLTGRAQYTPDPSLAVAMSGLFEKALGSAGYSTGQELADALDEAIRQTASTPTVDYRMGRRTSVGMVRTLNEDSLLTVEITRILQSQVRPLGVYVVADGMGGHSAGEVASATVVNAIAQCALAVFATPAIQAGTGSDWPAWLKSAVDAANAAVHDMRKSVGLDMGTTMVMAVLEGSNVHVAHVGDSRIYCLNAQSIRRLTTDHSLVQRLIETGQITPEEARHHPQRNVIYRTMGDKSKVEPDINTYSLNTGDRILLCSDGLSGMVTDADIQRLVLASPNPQAACDALINAANAAGGEDNITAILIELVQPA